MLYQIVRIANAVGDKFANWSTTYFKNRFILRPKMMIHLSFLLDAGLTIWFLYQINLKKISSGDDVWDTDLMAQIKCFSMHCFFYVCTYFFILSISKSLLQYNLKLCSTLIAVFCIPPNSSKNHSF